MSRIALALEYDGTDFIGWQTQRSGRSVQSTLAAAVSTVAAENLDVHGAGRTDTGVHAQQQVAHFDTTASRSSRQWLLGINANLPNDIAVQWVREVSADFDARRSAISRHYRYLIHRSETRPALARRKVWWLREALDCAAMNAAAAHWLGEHDFSAFRAANCQSRTPMRHLISVEVRQEHSLIELHFIANAFLYHMVRNLVGSLVEIGRGRQHPVWAQALLHGRDRKQAAETAPANGLTLMAVHYPSSFGLPPLPVGAALSRE